MGEEAVRSARELYELRSRAVHCDQYAVEEARRRVSELDALIVGVLKAKLRQSQ